jgi:hypothetical protein
MEYLCTSLLIVANVIYKRSNRTLSLGYEKAAEIGTCATIIGGTKFSWIYQNKLGPFIQIVQLETNKIDMVL